MIQPIVVREHIGADGKGGRTYEIIAGERRWRASQRAGLSDVIGEMVDYTMSHFAFEESLMENAGYLFSGPHKKVHDLFVRKVAEMQSRFEGGEDVTEELHGMLSRWLFNHIRNEDHGYVDSAKALPAHDGRRPAVGARATQGRGAA